VLLVIVVLTAAHVLLFADFPSEDIVCPAAATAISICAEGKNAITSIGVEIEIANAAVVLTCIPISDDILELLLLNFICLEVYRLS
jgi:hypothetical protein